ncbi:M81 family metallopeptidase [Ruania alba]|nr:M81 family metallopeptidase [Ruania alba]
MAILGFHHETNTFAPTRATIDVWCEAGVLEGAAIRQEYGSARSTVAGYIEFTDNVANLQGVPLVFSRLTPMGPITDEAFEYLCERLLGALVAEGPWDGVLVAAHGAAVSETYRDADGEFLRRIREIVGPSVVVGATLDMHANVSSLMVESADLIVAYQTNPHLDAFEQAERCARMVLDAIVTGVRPHMALTRVPLAANILQMGTEGDPMRSILAEARRVESFPEVLAVSVLEGFPYADVAEMGMSVIAITRSSIEHALDVSNAVAERVWGSRSDLNGSALPVAEALREADTLSRSPVILLDTGDNVGGGGPGDATHILHAAREARVRGVVQVICDPQAVMVCESAGVGSEVVVAVGGRTDGVHGRPFPVVGHVTAVSDGVFEDAVPTHAGFRHYNNGPTVAIETDEGYRIVVVSRPAPTTSLEQFRSVGIEPADQRIIVAKGVHSPRPAFDSIAGAMILVGTPGVTTVEISELPYEHRRQPMYPYEPTTTWAPATVVRGAMGRGRDPQARVHR